MTERFSEEEDNDPFSPANIGTINTIMQMRIYDVLMALLTEKNAGAARRLLNLHAEGGIFGPFPSLNGTFVTDAVKAEDEEFPDVSRPEPR